MSNKKFDAIIAGHVCLDLTPKFDIHGKAVSEVLRPGKLVEAGECCISLGGPVSNTGIAMSILGQDVALMCKVGKDMFGRIVSEKITEYGTDKIIALDDEEETSYTVAVVIPGNDRIFLHDPGANRNFGAEDVDYSQVEDCRLFHFGYPPQMRRIYLNNGAELTEMFKRAKAAGATTSLDMAQPDPNSEGGKQDWNTILKNTLPYVDIYIPSVEETMFMLYPDMFDEFRRVHADENDPLETMDANILPVLGEKLLEYGAKIAVIKCGVRGYYIRTAEKLEGFGAVAPSDLEEWSGREIICESFHVDNIQSATGSGDSSIAGFLSSFLNGAGIYDCIETACAVGSRNLTALDALSGIKTMEETHELMKTLTKNVYTYDEAYWTRDEKTGLIFGKCDKTQK
ncbi:MAG: carbohydrate kinase family protein [Clostridia bacterium]|nr:carbohydrate kinase family protein [Clostridia bacterium]